MTDSTHGLTAGPSPLPSAREIVTRAAMKIAAEAISLAVNAIVSAERAAPRAIVVPHANVRIVTTTPIQARDVVDGLLDRGFTAEQIEWEA